jgi:hypothetical protein
MGSSAASYETARRSTRVRAQIPLRVVSLDPNIEFNESCHTVVVNPEGCGVRMPKAVPQGLPVLLDELPVGNSVRARVTSCVPLGTDGKYWLVGVALEHRGNIWCIQPAPADWGTEAVTTAAVPLPKKEGEWPYSLFSTKGEAHPGRK